MVKALLLASLVTLTVSGTTYAADSSAPAATPQETAPQAQQKESPAAPAAPAPGKSTETKKDQPAGDKSDERKTKASEG